MGCLCLYCPLVVVKVDLVFPVVQPTHSSKPPSLKQLDMAWTTLRQVKIAVLILFCFAPLLGPYKPLRLPAVPETLTPQSRWTTSLWYCYIIKLLCAMTIWEDQSAANKLGTKINLRTDPLRIQRSLFQDVLTYAVGLLAYITEKSRTWSDCGGDVERCFNKDELLTNICIYWCVTSSSCRKGQIRAVSLQNGDATFKAEEDWVRLVNRLIICSKKSLKAALLTGSMGILPPPSACTTSL